MTKKVAIRRKGPLSPVQEKIWCFILGFIDERGYAPTRKEIGIHLTYKGNWVVEMVGHHLRAMEEKNYLKLAHDATVRRGIEIVTK